MEVHSHSVLPSNAFCMPIKFYCVEGDGTDAFYSNLEFDRFLSEFDTSLTGDIMQSAHHHLQVGVMFALAQNKFNDLASLYCPCTISSSLP